MSSQIVKIGIIGTNYGGMVHLPAFKENPCSEVVAICGRNKEKIRNLAKKFNVPYALCDYRDLLELDVDVVTIATPPETHKKIVFEAAKRKKHLLCEKPFGCNVSEAVQMYNVIEKAGVIHLVGHQMRFQLQRAAVKKILENGDLGRILHVNLDYSTSNRIDPGLPWDWWSDIKRGGGQLYAMGSHQIDLLRWWFGEVKWVSGELKTITKQRRDLKSNKLRKVTSDELASFQLGFENGVFASCVVSSVALGWKGPSIQIYGEKASLFLEGEQNLTMFRKTTAMHDLSVKDPLLTEGWVSGSEWRASFARMADDFVCAIKDGRPVAGATFLDGLRTHRTMEAIRQSAQEKRRIEIRHL